MAMEKTQEGATVKVVLQKLSLLPLSFPSPDEALEPHLSRNVQLGGLRKVCEVLLVEESSHLLSSRSYRIKSQHVHYNLPKHSATLESTSLSIDIALTDEDKFILRILEFNGESNVSKNNLTDYLNRLAVIKNFGCKAYELIESPQILKLSEKEIEERFHRLNSIGVSKVSMKLLNYARPSKTDSELRHQVRLYLKQLHGSVNSIDALVEALGCSDNVMLSILMRNPRLAGQHGPGKDVISKINFLRAHNARPEDLWQNTNMLKNVRLDVVQSRTKKLAELGYNNPLPVEFIARTEGDFKKIIERLVKNFGNKVSHSETADAVKYVLDMLPLQKGRKALVARLKIEYLLSKGYRPEQIIACSKILEVPNASLCKAVEELQMYSLDGVTLDDCLCYARVGRVTISRLHVRRMIAQVLGCIPAELPPLLARESSIRGAKVGVVKANRDFLYSVGFVQKQLSLLPLVLLHSNEVLQLHWKTVTDPNNRSPASVAYRNSVGSPEKQLNILQYAIEHAANFHYASLVFVDKVESEASEDSPGKQSGFGTSGLCMVDEAKHEHEENCVDEEKVNSGNSSYSSLSSSCPVHNSFFVRTKSFGVRMKALN